MDNTASKSVPTSSPPWFRQTKAFEVPSRGRALWQLINSFAVFLSSWILTVVLWKVGLGYPWILPLIVVSGLSFVRIFIVFHDCCHESYFRSKKANAFWGWLIGILTYTPYLEWRKDHGIHHASTSNLDLRGVGDIWTLTLEEYRALGFWMRLWYRVYRNPFFLFLTAPPVLFILLQRIPRKGLTKKDKLNAHLTSLAVVALALSIGFFLGWDVLFFVHLPIFYVTSVVGVWLFYVQHQFDPGYWEHSEGWTSWKAALVGSSHYKLPKVLQWVSGNIGFHHIHHLRPRIPNYNLERCYKAVKELQLPHPLTFWKSFSALTLHVWDEKSKRLLSFRQVRLADGRG
jgi:omega-6 fatty acid desaturase (delta-12 desaturase)